MVQSFTRSHIPWSPADIWWLSPALEEQQCIDVIHWDVLH